MITEDEQKQINGSKSKTFPFIMMWLLAYPIIYVLELKFKLGIKVSYFLYIAAGVCFAYMCGEFTADIFRNMVEPGRTGKIENIEHHRGIVAIWILYAFLASAYSYVFKIVAPDEANQTIMFAGMLTMEYIAGTKSNKAVINKKEEEEK